VVVCRLEAQRRWIWVALCRPELAAEIDGLADTHPTTDLETRKVEVNKLMRELQAALPADELAAALERGKTRDLETTVRGLLTQSWEE
jgi:hypothetical protein